MNDEQLWCTIREELEDIGITAVAFDANKDFIFEWFTKAFANGAFRERSSNDSPNCRTMRRFIAQAIERHFNSRLDYQSLIYPLQQV